MPLFLLCRWNRILPKPYGFVSHRSETVSWNKIFTTFSLWINFYWSFRLILYDRFSIKWLDMNIFICLLENTNILFQNNCNNLHFCDLFISMTLSVLIIGENVHFIRKWWNLLFCLVMLSFSLLLVILL